MGTIKQAVMLHTKKVSSVQDPQNHFNSPLNSNVLPKEYINQRYYLCVKIGIPKLSPKIYFLLKIVHNFGKLRFIAGQLFQYLHLNEPAKCGSIITLAGTTKIRTTCTSLCLLALILKIAKPMTKHL